MTTNKYERAAELLDSTSADIDDAVFTLLELAAQLPEGEAERVLREAAAQKQPTEAELKSCWRHGKKICGPCAWKEGPDRS